MDFDEIKNLKPQNGERYIIVENGKPVLVLISFEDYQKIFSRIQKEFKFKQSSPAKTREGSKENQGELTLEDLPF